jgi:neutral ceramidase
MPNLLIGITLFEFFVYNPGNYSKYYRAQKDLAMTIQRALYAGVSRKITSPPTGIFLMGYGNRVQGNLGIHDDLTVTTLIFDDGNARAAILAADHAFINARVVAQIKKRLRSECQIAPEAVFVCCSHTHAGPIGYADEQSRPEDHAYIAFLVDTLVASAVEAQENLETITLRSGIDEAHININRRERQPDGSIIIGQNPDGIVDHSVQVLQLIKANNEVLATLVNYACHPVVMGPLNRMASADWVGAMRRTVEGTIPGTCLFIQGATGDINPRKMRWTSDNWDEVEEQGQAVGEAVLRACKKSSHLEAGAIQFRQSTEWIKLLPAKGYNDQIRSFLPPGLSDDEIQAAVHREMPWHTQLEDRAGATYAAMNTGVLRIGDWALATLETEPFAETGLAIKAASPAKMTFVAGYTNGCNSYLPVKRAYEDGGYEVETAPLFYGLPAPFAPGGAEQVTNAIIDMLSR